MFISCAYHNGSSSRDVLYVQLVGMGITRKKHRRYKKRARKHTRHQRGGVHPDRTYVFIVAYRAKAPHTARRDELKRCIDSIKTAFAKYKRKYKVFIVEQNNDYPFNLGILKNIGFLEEEKVPNPARVYLHMNTDYSIDSNKEFPKELEEFDGNGFFDLYSVGEGTYIGGCTCFNSDVFKKINGFPTNLYGWGADDTALLKRVEKFKVPHILSGVLNNGWILADAGSDSVNSSSKPRTNFENFAKIKDDSDTNGLTTTVYTVDGDGEFKDDANHVVHKLVNFEYKP